MPVLVAPVPSGLPQYDRSTWQHWTDEDGDCQNARQEVLIAESRIAVTFRPDGECRVIAGSWEGPYTGDIVSDPGDLDIDHLVPLANAHRSGAWNWSRERKRDYANYLGDENHLIATTSSANRGKGSKGPEDWRPPLESYWCSYAVDWATIKNQWGLTVTEAEYAALTEMLATCAIPVLLQPGRAAPPLLPTATALPSPPPGMRYDPFGPDRNCGDFDTYEEALAFFLAAGGPSDDPHNLDTNGDGQPCESLPGGPSAKESPAPLDKATPLHPPMVLGSAVTGADCTAVGPPQTALPAASVGTPNEPDCQPASTLDATPTLAATLTPIPVPTAAPAPPASPEPSLTLEPTPTHTLEPTPTPHQRIHRLPSQVRRQHPRQPLRPNRRHRRKKPLWTGTAATFPTGEKRRRFTCPRAVPTATGTA